MKNYIYFEIASIELKLNEYILSIYENEIKFIGGIMKEEKETKIISILYFFSSVIFYIVAILRFFDKNQYMGVVYLCLGSAFLCFGSVYLNKYKKKNNNEDDNKNEG